jgi:UDP-N-acetylglucosamine transferase subunit ALG13
LRLSEKIQDIYDEHQIIISHGGAGTLLYLLANPKPGRKIIAVANSTLAGNHQIELVEKLHQEGYLLGFTTV